MPSPFLVVIFPSFKHQVMATGRLEANNQMAVFLMDRNTAWSLPWIQQHSGRAAV